MNLRFGDRRRALQKIEVAAFVGLSDMLRIHRSIAARIAYRRRRPGGVPALELVVAHMQMDAARGDVDLDLVACRHERERAADEAFRRDVQNAGTVARA